MVASCIFCAIASKQQPANIVFENEAAVAFLDIRPLVDGHTMVIPRQHYERLTEVPAALLGGLFAAVREVTRKVDAALGVRATTIGINDGADAGQVVPHLHVHVIPRTAGDGGGNIHSIVRRRPRIALEEMRERIRKA